MSKTVNGRKPLSAKAKRPAPIVEPDFFTNKLTMSDSLRSELESKGLEWRFIDYKKYVGEGNQHSRGWKVYKQESKPTDSGAFLFGNDPDGIIRRGSTVLAVRPIEYGEKHRSWLDEKANRYKGFKKSKAEELRQMAKENSVDSIVDDEFDGDSED